MNMNKNGFLKAGLSYEGALKAYFSTSALYPELIASEMA